MNLAPAISAPADIANPVRIPYANSWKFVEILRREGSAAPMPADVVAQAHATLPQNFGLPVLLDIRAGARYGSFASIEDARAGARRVGAAGEGVVGVIQHVEVDGPVRSFEVVDLRIPDVHSTPWPESNPHGMPTWSNIGDAPLHFGDARADSRWGGRVVEEVVLGPELLRRRGAPMLVDAFIGAGNVRLGFDVQPDPHGFLHSRIETTD